MTAHDAPRPARVAAALRWVGAAVIVAVAIARCVIVLTPQVAFDTDPAGAAGPMSVTEFGPAGSLLLDALLLSACACALLGEWRSGRGIDPLLCALAVVPLPIVLWHGWNDAENLWRGMSWFAAAIACVTVAHMSRQRLMRIAIASVLAAALMPLMSRGAVQVVWEHPQTVRAFELQREDFLSQRGWAPDSAAARIFERRLRQPQPTAWFATTNVFASCMAFGVVLCCGLTVGAIRARTESGFIAAMALCAAMAAASLWLTSSKGAIAAALAGLGLLAVPVIAAYSSLRAPRLVLGLLMVTFLAVIARGTLLPEGFASEKSLLFRWHYAVASARMFAEHPLQGVGPGGYQEAYALHRLPRNPEEVVSAHSMFLDWVCSLGVGGLAWVGLVIALLWRAHPADAASRPSGLVPPAGPSQRASGTSGSGCGQDEGRRKAVPPAVRAVLRCALTALALGLVPAMLIEWPALDGVSIAARVVGIGGFLAITIVVAHVMDAADERLVSAALIAAAGALLIHGQIEMTFQQPGSVVWAMCAVGLIGCTRPRGGIAAGLAGLTSPALCAGIAAWLAAWCVPPALRQERAMLSAAAALSRADVRHLDEGLAIRARQAAAEALVQAYEAWPGNVKPLEAAAIQLERASTRAAPGSEPIGLLLQGQELAQRAFHRHGALSSASIAMDLSVRLALATGDAEHWNTAVQMARVLTERDPHSISAWRRMGDVLWLIGKGSDSQPSAAADPNIRAARNAYRRALENDANFELDELKRLSQHERTLLEQRIAVSQAGEARNAESGP